MSLQEGLCRAGGCLGVRCSRWQRVMAAAVLFATACAAAAGRAPGAGIAAAWHALFSAAVSAAGAASIWRALQLARLPGLSCRSSCFQAEAELGPERKCCCGCCCGYLWLWRSRPTEGQCVPRVPGAAGQWLCQC